MLAGIDDKYSLIDHPKSPRWFFPDQCAFQMPAILWGLREIRDKFSHHWAELSQFFTYFPFYLHSHPGKSMA